MTIIRFDECLSWRIVAALRELRIARDLELETPHERGEEGSIDVSWIEQFRDRGGRCFVSGDARMRRVVGERAALQASGLVGIFPPAGKFYDDLRRFRQAAYFIAWFPVIEELARSGPAGTHYRLPTSFSGDRADIIEMPALVS